MIPHTWKSVKGPHKAKTHCNASKMEQQVLCFYFDKRGNYYYYYKILTAIVTFYGMLFQKQ